MRIKISGKAMLMYALYAAVTVCINHAAKGVPLSFGLCFAMLACGANLFVTPIVYVLAALPAESWVGMLVALYEGAFACAVTAIYRRAKRKIKYEFALLAAVAMAPFVAFSPWQGTQWLGYTDNVYIIKAVAAGVAVAFAPVCLKGVYALLYRLCRCRLGNDELVCLALMGTVAGMGLYNLCGLYACLCIGCGLVAFGARLFGDATALAVACASGLPPVCAGQPLTYVALLCLLACICLLLVQGGRGAPCAAAAACGAVYFYFNGGFDGEMTAAVLHALLLIVCCALPALPSGDTLERLLDALRVKKTVPQVFERELRDHISRRLFDTGQVFREIEDAFNRLDQTPVDLAVQRQALDELRARLCAQCQRRAVCGLTDVYDGFARLMHSGMIKGRISLVDLPAEVTSNCVHPTEAMNEINSALGRIKKLTTETENARSGRRLLANQARGIAEVLKSAAVDIARTPQDSGHRIKAVRKQLEGAGICCTEVKLDESGGEVYLTVAGEVKAARLVSCLGAALGATFALKDKVIYGAGRACYIFVQPPAYDAAFGVAFAIKDGERYSGDTHSVIKINEHSFLMALCDGMGSGEGARKVSSVTMSLIEAFFKAEMPYSTILETVNKLMTFNRDESFTCMDIAAIDLNTLEGAFIKIGSPPCIIIKGDGIKILESTSLPLGILDSIHPTVCTEKLNNGDLVVFMSDGITSSFPSATDLYAFIEQLKPLNPQELADGILAEAKKAAHGAAVDDMTVLCVRLFSHAN